MFSKEEAKNLRIEFWTAFGIYMRQHIPLAGTKQKWTNYKTGVKGLYFRMDADKRIASISIDITDPDPGIRAIFFEQWEEMKTYLEMESGIDWQWQPEYFNDMGQGIARISHEIEGLSIYDKGNWSALFAFFEQGIVALDSIWADCNEIFKDLAK